MSDDPTVWASGLDLLQFEKRSEAKSEAKRSESEVERSESESQAIAQRSIH